MQQIFIFPTESLIFPGFEGDERTQYLAARTERERDKWIAALHIASYECMEMQLESLREQIKEKTGKDPLVQAESQGNQPINEGEAFVPIKNGADARNLAHFLFRSHFLKIAN